MIRLVELECCKSGFSDVCAERELGREASVPKHNASARKKRARSNADATMRTSRAATLVAAGRFYPKSARPIVNSLHLGRHEWSRHVRFERRLLDPDREA